MATAARTTLQFTEPPTVVVSDSQALFRGFVETDTGVVEALRGADDPAVDAHRLLALGARAAHWVASITGAEALEARLEVMTAGVETAVAQRLAELKQATTALLHSEDGELARLLGRFGNDLTGMLDPSQRDSAAGELAGALRSVMDEVLEAHTRQVRNLVDPRSDDGPVGQVVTLVRDHTNLLGDEVRRLAEVVVADRARAEGLDRSGLKGLSYEETVFAVVAEIAAATGDVAEHVGRDKGGRGTLKGDIVVHLNPEETCGRPVRYALEAKTGKGRLRSSLEELDQVMENRDALASVIVYSDPHLAPCKVPFQPYDNRAIVVFDRTSSTTGPCDSAACGLAGSCVVITTTLPPDHASTEWPSLLTGRVEHSTGLRRSAAPAPQPPGPSPRPEASSTNSSVRSTLPSERHRGDRGPVTARFRQGEGQSPGASGENGKSPAAWPNRLATCPARDPPTWLSPPEFHTWPSST